MLSPFLHKVETIGTDYVLGPKLPPAKGAAPVAWVEQFS